MDSGGTNAYMRAGLDVTDPVVSDSGATYTPGISESRGGTTTFLHSGMKDATLQTSTSQAVTGKQVYDAFGNLQSLTGTWSGPFAYCGEHGYQTDPDSGLQLLGHRYYDASTGRFLTRDHVKDGRNWYAYCGNNPVAREDATGNEDFGLWFDKHILGGRVGEAGGTWGKAEQGKASWGTAIWQATGAFFLAMVSVACLGEGEGPVMEGGGGPISEGGPIEAGGPGDGGGGTIGGLPIKKGSLSKTDAYHSRPGVLAREMYDTGDIAFTKGNYSQSIARANSREKKEHRN